MRPTHEVADVLRKLGKNVEHLGLNSWQLRTLSALKNCRTARLGGHVDACDGCGNISISYNSCRNRHCPKCLGNKREEWILARSQELLPVPYFHVVFTLPDKLNALAMHEPALVYNSLFAAAWQTLQQFGKSKGLKMAMIAVLHTWGQNLSLHPHLHCIVPGGGIDKAGKWQNIRADGKYLFPVKAMSKVFRAKYVALLRESDKTNKVFIQSLFEKPWVVYAKRPFGGPKSVVEYLGRYTHKVAISNHRIQNIDEQNISFSYKQYQNNGTKAVMTLKHNEFIRRFALHILPKGLVRIRHFGFLSSCWKKEKLIELQKLLYKEKAVPEPKKPEKSPEIPCPHCKTGVLRTIMFFDDRGPPAQYILDKVRNIVPQKS